LGGYRTLDGQRVKCGLLFRSGTLAGLTLADWKALRARGLRTICDFRSNAERLLDGFGAAKPEGIRHFTHDYESGFGELRRLMAEAPLSGEGVRSAMIAGYRSLPFFLAPAYRSLFTCLSGGEVPLIFNCTAGKDRAGTAAALILSALRVPRETIVDDYLLTNACGRLSKAMLQRADRKSLLSSQSVAAADAVLFARPQYIDAALAAVEEKHGSVEGYLREALGVEDTALQEIRRRFLE
jgi:protein-tyrosine phosphatase